MAKVNNNILVDGLCGSLARQLIIRQDKAGRTVVAARPVFREDRVFSPAQLARQRLFREAAAYAMRAKDDPLYARLSEGTPRNAYNLAISDWFHPPEIVALDLSGWHGLPGGVIRVDAVDDVLVARVSVAIDDGSGTLLEQGPAKRLGSLRWEYVSTTAVGQSWRVLVAAQDLPGHVTQRAQSAA